MKKAIICMLIIAMMVSVVFGSSVIVASEDEDISTVTINDVKSKVEEYINMSMNKYDHTGTKKVCYDGIIEKDNSFYQYAEKMAQLENSRYRAFPELALEDLTVDIEYGEITLEGTVYSVDATVYETKKYVGQSDPGYVCTQHLITVEKKDTGLYITDDVTNSALDSSLRSQSKSRSIADLDYIIEQDAKNIQDILTAEKSNCTKNEKENNLGANYENQASTRYATYSLDCNSMYQYARKYNAASPYSTTSRNQHTMRTSEEIAQITFHR